MPGESYRRWLRSSLLCLCDVFQALINSIVCWDKPKVNPELAREPPVTLAESQQSME